MHLISIVANRKRGPYHDNNKHYKNDIKTNIRELAAMPYWNKITSQNTIKNFQVLAEISCRDVLAEDPTWRCSIGLINKRESIFADS